MTAKSAPVVESLHVHPSVLFQLGHDLITDEVQALIELIKNSFDADARKVGVEVVTDPESAALHGKTLSEPWLAVSDDGRGMTPDELIAGWLTISNSWKREFKLAGKRTAAGRTPLGDKGLGRLGTQRLGGRVTIHTRPFGSEVTYQVTLPWDEFEVAATLDSIRLEIRESDIKKARPGTTIVIQKLDPGFLELATEDRLIRQMSEMVSPFEEVKDFKIRVRLNGVAVDLMRLPTELRKSAEVSYAIDYKDGLLRVRPRIDHLILTGNSPDEQDRFDRWIRPDAGKSFGAWLARHHSSRLNELGVKVGSGSRLVVGELTVPISEIPGVAFASGEPIDPGPFRGEVDALDLDHDRTGNFSSRQDYRSYVRVIGGVRVYRDGFAVRTDRDWLGLSKRASSGRSFYGIRPGTEIGFISISARDNAVLTETTNREGFQKTPALQSFLAINSYWLAYSDRLQSFVRRQYLEYVKELGRDTTSSRPTTPQEAAASLGALVDSSREIQQLGLQSSGQLQTAAKVVRDSIDDLDRTRVSPENIDEVVARLRGVLQTALSLIDEATQKQARVDQFVSSVVDSGRELSLVTDAIDQAKSQLTDAWEMVAVGLASEAIVHELRQVVNGIVSRTSSLRLALKETDALDVRLSTYFEHVATSMRALLKQAAHLDPGLRYLRDNRTEVDLVAFAEEYRAFYSSTWNGKDDPKFRVVIERSGRAIFNRGRLTQVVDNLVLNSRYWVSQQVKKGAAPGFLTLTVDGPTLRFRDDGPGIAAAVEASLFEPFVTLKPAAEGRGLGLYVARMLLQAEGGSIDLGPERDADGKFRGFEIRLEGKADD
jgi:signal transduction histidine kinase